MPKPSDGHSRSLPAEKVVSPAARQEKIKSAALLQDYLATGSQGAARELFGRYAERLIQRASLMMGDRLRQKVDPDDVVQSVYKSFLVGARQGKFTLQDSGRLWALLVTMTFHKVREKAGHFRTQGRSSDKETPLGDQEILSREPTPDEAALLCDQVTQLLQHFREPAHRQIIERFLQGVPVPRIAQDAKLSVQRVQQLIRQARTFLGGD